MIVPSSLNEIEDPNLSFDASPNISDPILSWTVVALGLKNVSTILIVTVLIDESSEPSFALKVKLSKPIKLVVGV